MALGPAAQGLSVLRAWVSSCARWARVLIGNYGDRAGRKAALTLTILLMALGTGIIAFSPTYAAIGVGAPALAAPRPGAAGIFGRRRSGWGDRVSARERERGTARCRLIVARGQHGNREHPGRARRLPGDCAARTEGCGGLGLANSLPVRDLHSARGSVSAADTAGNRGLSSRGSPT